MSKQIDDNDIARNTDEYDSDMRELARNYYKKGPGDI